MTNTRTWRLAPVLLIAAGCLVLGSTGGAVADAFLDGGDIQNGSLTGKDLKDRSVKAKDINAGTLASLRGPAGPAGANGTNGANGVSGYQIVEDSEDYIAGDGSTFMSLDCPAGKRLLGITGHWSGSNAAVQTLMYDDGTGGAVWTDGVPDDDTLNIRLACATVPGATVAAAQSPRDNKS